MMVTSSASNGPVLDTRAGEVPAPKQGRKLARPAIALMAVVMFQLLFASVFLGALHRPALHHASVAVVGTSPVADAVSAPAARGQAA